MLRNNATPTTSINQALMRPVVISGWTVAWCPLPARYVSVCHGSHRTVYSLASGFWGGSEYGDGSPSKGRERRYLPHHDGLFSEQPHGWYPSGSVSTTKAPSHQYVSRTGLRKERRSTSIGPVGSCAVAQSLVSVVSFGAARGQGRTLGLVPLESAWSQR
jgi:hypothetical protein